MSKTVKVRIKKRTNLNPYWYNYISEAILEVDAEEFKESLHDDFIKVSNSEYNIRTLNLLNLTFSKERIRRELKYRIECIEDDRGALLLKRDIEYVGFEKLKVLICFIKRRYKNKMSRK